MIKEIKIALLIILLLAGEVVLAQQSLAVPIKLSVYNNDDVCASLEVVKNVTPHLNVRTGPGLNHAVIDRVYTGDKVHVCDIAANQDWYGVIYTQGDFADCDIVNLLDQQQIYHGACKTGWINRHYLKIIAG